MFKLKIFEEGFEDYEDEVFETEAEAQECMNTLMSECRTGAETLNLSNPGDYPYDEDDNFDIDYEIIEI